MNKNQILNLLDENWFDFPALDNVNINLAQTRLSVFRDVSDWLLAIEVVGFTGEYLNYLYAFGSNCRENGIIYWEEVLDFPEHPIDDDGNFLISPYHIHVYIKDEEIRIKPTREDYKDAGIDPEPFGPTKLLRFLCHFYGEKFWLDDKTIFQAAGIGKNMPLFFRTEKWKHLKEEDFPSENTFFQQLALAIEKNDASMIEIKDPNTHWSNWTYSDFPDDGC